MGYRYLLGIQINREEYLVMSYTHTIFGIMTESQIQKVLLEHYFPKGYKFCCTNFCGCGLGECDVIAVSSAGRVYEYEIKRSLSDFKADFKKPKHKMMQDFKEEDYWEDGWFPVPNHFYFVCSKDLIKKEEIPQHAGLIYVPEVEIIKKAPLIHKHKASQRLIESLCQNLTAKLIYGCSYMNYMRK